MNGCLIFLKYSFEYDLCSFWLIVQKGGHMLHAWREQDLMLISNVLRKGMAPNCLLLLPPTKMRKNPTKI
jgi:hypothetical protein